MRCSPKRKRWRRRRCSPIERLVPPRKRLALGPDRAYRSELRGVLRPPPTALLPPGMPWQNVPPKPLIAAEQPPLPKDQHSFTSQASRMTVPGSIGARGPEEFVVDTGAQRTVVSRDLAGLLG